MGGSGLPGIACAGPRVKPRRLHRWQASSHRGACEAESFLWELACQGLAVWACLLPQGACEAESFLWELACQGLAVWACLLPQGTCEAESFLWELACQRLAVWPCLLPQGACGAESILWELACQRLARRHCGQALGPLTGQATNGLISLSTNMLCISLIPVRRRITDMAKSAKVSRSRETTCNRKSASPPML